MYLNHLYYKPGAPIHIWDKAYFYSILAGVFYTSSYFILPRFLRNKRYVSLIAYSLGLYLVYAFLSWFQDWHLYKWLDPGSETPPFDLKFFLVKSIYTFAQFYFYGFGYWFAIESVQREKAKVLAEQQKLLAEQQRSKAEQEALRVKLAFYNSQFNPHFLYNTLNSFYSMAYDTNERLAEGIMKLSEMMRFFLQGNSENVKKISLSDEVHNMRNVIDLQQMRFKDQLYIHLNIENEDEMDHKVILPLILINFVENAFKHGKLTDPINPLIINLSAPNGTIHFFIKNKKGRKRRIISTGLGLENVKQRLDLTYPGKYNLEIRDEEFDFSCSLSIPS
ncbi:sensor histidine kinase [Xanthocytophaga flava]|uniref:sensor histidine kinase n=1 Tax=Xanthocytophaga flava TaxID=3048013 RepID=UPI0028D055DD|nr:histidine kinase [Xanthocytophaga flavus]MDJ1470242.1 histidine kinase [Xanthocytophaga flavus]